MRNVGEYFGAGQEIGESVSCQVAEREDYCLLIKGGFPEIELRLEGGVTRNAFLLK